MWSIGVITYVILSGTPPFLEKSNEKIFEKILKAEYSFPSQCWDLISDSAQNFIKKLLIKDPKTRMTADEALEHEWLNNDQEK